VREANLREIALGRKGSDLSFQTVITKVPASQLMKYSQGTELWQPTSQLPETPTAGSQGELVPCPQ